MASIDARRTLGGEQLRHRVSEGLIRAAGEKPGEKPRANRPRAADAAMAELTKLPAALQERVAHSLAIIYQALDTYKCANLQLVTSQPRGCSRYAGLASCPSVTMAAKTAA